MRATAAFLVSNEKETNVQVHMKDLLPHIIQVSALEWVGSYRVLTVIIYCCL